MKNDKLIIAVIAIVVLVVVGGGAYYGFSTYQADQEVKQQMQAKQKAQEQAQQAQLQADAAMAARTKCDDTSAYHVVTLDHDNSSAGQDILVKQKVDGQACKYEVADGDFEIKNADAEYFKAIGANSMVTDIGTGPTGRSFRLYDLVEKKLIVEKKYFGDLSIASTSLTYEGEPKTKIKGCQGETVVEKTIDLKTLLVKEGKTTKCEATQ